MAGYGEPDWANAQNNDTNAPVSDANVVPGVQVSAAGAKNEQGYVLVFLSLLNMGLSVLMCALGALTILGIKESGDAEGSSFDVGEPFLAFYMIVFAVLLFVYELMWWSPVPELNRNMRKNFGFMYGIQGKGLYLIFVAFLTIGFGADHRVLIINYFTGVLFLLAGCLHIYVVCRKPEIARQYQPPGQGFAAADEVNETVV